jgi:hypothetical protein
VDGCRRLRHAHARRRLSSLYGFTIFFLPLTQELGLSRAATSLVFSLARAEGAVEGPLSGYLIDRFGPRPMMLAGVILSGVGYMLLAGVESYYANIPLLTIRESPVWCSRVEIRESAKRTSIGRFNQRYTGGQTINDDASQTEPLTH